MKKRIFILIDCTFIVLFALMMTMCGGDGGPTPLSGPADILDVDAGTHTMELPGGEKLTINTPVPLTCNTSLDPSANPPGSNIRPIRLEGTLSAGHTISLSVFSDIGFSPNDVIVYVDSGAWTPLVTSLSINGRTISATIFSYMVKSLYSKQANGPGEVILGIQTIAPSYSISGTVTDGGTGTDVLGVEVILSGDASGLTTTDVNGDYNFGGLASGIYRVTSRKTNYSFDPIYSTVIIVKADVLNVDFESTAAAATYNISGNVTDSGTGLGLEGIMMTLSGAVTDTATTDINGDYNFSGITDGDYTVSPYPNLSAGDYTVSPDYTFDPVSINVNISGADVSNVDFVGTPAGGIYSISGQITYDTGSGVIGFRGVHMTLSGAVSGSTITDASGNYTFSGLVDGDYTVTQSPSFAGGDPTATLNYTFDPVSRNVTISGADATGVDFSATGPSYAISGSVNNWRLGGGVSGVEMTLDTIPALSVFTDSWGNYTTSSIPNGNYSLTPSLNGSRVAFYPPEKTLTVAGSNLFGVHFDSTIIHSVSGSVSYPGTKTGWVHINVIDQHGWESDIGTSIKVTGPGSWPFTIRGFEAGTYVLEAFIDNLGYGTPNASNPRGSSAVFDVVDFDITGQSITLADPGTITPVVPGIAAVFPANQSATIMWDGPTDANDREIAQSYNVYWSTSSSVSKTEYDDMTNVPAIDTVFLARGLTDGSDYYFVVTAVADGTESAESSTFGPVTIGAISGNYTISGTITFSQAATGPMYVIVYNEEGANVYFTYIGSPSSPQSYSISGVPADSWYFFVFLDMNDNGQIDIGEYFPDWEDIEIVVTGNTTQNLTIGQQANASAEVRTWHNEGGNYSLRLEVEEESKHLVKASLVSGPHLPGVIDFGYDEYEVGTRLNFYTTRPNVGDTYSFDITYSDSTTETLHASVTTVLDSFATPISPVGSVPGATHPTFTWAAPDSPPPLYEYGIGVWEYMGGSIWWNDEIPSSTTSVEFNFDDEAEQDPLTSGSQYSWSVKVIDSNGNVAESMVKEFTP